jgi:hypothetical protein
LGCGAIGWLLLLLLLLKLQREIVNCVHKLSWCRRRTVFAPISGAYHTLSGSMIFFKKKKIFFSFSSFHKSGWRLWIVELYSRISLKFFHCELGRELQIHIDVKISTSVVEGTLIWQNLQAGISNSKIACVWGRFTFQKMPMLVIFCDFSTMIPGSYPTSYQPGIMVRK